MRSCSFLSAHRWKCIACERRKGRESLEIKQMMSVSDEFKDSFCSRVDSALCFSRSANRTIASPWSSFARPFAPLRPIVLAKLQRLPPTFSCLRPKLWPFSKSLRDDRRTFRLFDRSSSNRNESSCPERNEWTGNDRTGRVYQITDDAVDRVRRLMAGLRSAKVLLQKR